MTTSSSPASFSSTPRVAVVGGGIAGLVAATRLARGGLPVTLFERRREPGGRATSVEREGFRMNMGPHALFRRGHFAATLAELGVPFSGPVNPVLPDLFEDGQVHLLPASPVALMRTTALDAVGKVEFGALMGAMLMIDPATRDHETVEDWLSTLRSERARRAVRTFARLTSYANAPDQLSLGAWLRQLAVTRGGVVYVDGGWQHLVEGLQQVALQAGVDLRTGAAVRRVDVQHGRVAAVDGEAFDAVVLALPPKPAARLAPDSAALRAVAERLVPIRAAVLDVGFDALPVPERRGCIGIDVPTYAIVHSDPAGIAPPGKVLMTTAWYRAPGDEADRRADLEAYLDGIQPGWRQAALFTRYLPSPTVSYALPRAADGGLAGRPPARVPDVEGLWIAGDHVGPRGMLSDCAAASAADAAEGILAAASRAAA